jgi:hypothetical protein
MHTHVTSRRGLQSRLLARFSSSARRVVFSLVLVTGIAAAIGVPASAAMSSAVAGATHGQLAGGGGGSQLPCGGGVPTSC